MSLRLSASKSKGGAISYYVVADTRDPETNKRSTTTIRKLGTLSQWMKNLDTTDPEVVKAHLKKMVKDLNVEFKDDKCSITIVLDPAKQIPKKEPQTFNAGYLYIRSILSSLKVDKICSSIKKEHKFEFDLSSILADLVCTRVLFPGSKRSSYEDAKKFLQQPEYDLHQIYRALPILEKHRYEIEAFLYKQSVDVCQRNTDVLYYDCTNFYFEREEEAEEGLAQYGKSKENRPNPIVQYGLFMDANGIPLADYVFPGNCNEQPSLRELESVIEKEFGESRFIVVADAGLNGWENKVLNDRSDKGYIVTQPVKKMKSKWKKWVLDPTGWKLLQTGDVVYDISRLTDDSEVIIDGKAVKTKDLVFYKEAWDIEKHKSKTAGKKYELESRMIVSFSQKYQKYQAHIRNKKLDRAAKMISNPSKMEKKDARNPRYYIKKITGEDEVIKYELDLEKIQEDIQYDGFYCVNTNLEDEDISGILKVNRQRWEIEECFRIMKNEFEARPIYVSRDESIKGHLLICFIALLCYRILEQKLGSRYTIDEIVSELKGMQVTNVRKIGFIPSFTRTSLTDELKMIFGFGLDNEITTNNMVKKILKNAGVTKHYAKKKK